LFEKKFAEMLDVLGFGTPERGKEWFHRLTNRKAKLEASILILDIINI
jgi:hypothetical protein